MIDLNKPDQRSKRFVFVPFCLLCQAFQARGIVRFGFSSTIKPIVEEILRHDVNIIQMPCPESQLGGYEEGLKRNPRSFNDYNNREFISLCGEIAKQVADQIKAIISNGFEVAAIVGMEYSPSCSVLLQYTNQGTFKNPGHFIAALKKELEQENINVPFVGINRKGIKSSIEKLREVLEKKLL